ncbi:MAG: DMT family transporter [Melioribacteraceae bacterium]|nr:DMT family transporter [Melioribacteraceae bacterium]
MNKFAPVFVIIAASLWGIDGIILRPALYNLPVPLVVLIETSIAAILLTPILALRLKSIKQLKLKDWIAFMGVALLGGAIGTMAITKALFYVNFVNLSVVILIQKLQPVFALTFAALFLKERLPKEFFLWAAFAIVGAYLMTFGFKLPILTTGDKTILAAGLSIIAAASFGSSTVLSKRALKNVSYETGTYLRFSITALIMLIINIFMNDFGSVSQINFHQWIIFLVIALTTGGIAIVFYYYGLKRISASVATICELAFPLTAVILEYFIHQNILSAVQWFGVTILLLSIIKVSGVKFIKSN